MPIIHLIDSQLIHDNGNQATIFYPSSSRHQFGEQGYDTLAQTALSQT